MSEITITISIPGNPPEVITGIKSFEMIVIPENDPENNTSFYTNMQPDGLAICGSWLISVAKAVRDNLPLPQFGEISSGAKKIYNRSPKGKSNLISETSLSMDDIEKRFGPPGKKR